MVALATLTVTCYEDNQRVLAVIKKGYSSKIRHLPKTHKINVASVSEMFRGSELQIEYIATDHQKGDILTKALGPQTCDLLKLGLTESITCVVQTSAHLLVRVLAASALLRTSHVHLHLKM